MHASKKGFFSIRSHMLLRFGDMRGRCPVIAGFPPPSKGRDSRIKPGFCVTRFEVKLLDLTLSRNGPKTDILAQVALRNAELMLLSNWRSCACFKEGVLIEKKNQIKPPL